MNTNEELNKIENKLKELSKKYKNPKKELSITEIYERLISNAFKEISKSKESATKFLIEAGIFDKTGHLSDEYKN